MASFTRNALRIAAVTLLSCVAASAPASAQAQRRVSLVPVLRRGRVRQAALGVALTVGW